jgi:hypothetical protein
MLFLFFHLTARASFKELQDWKVSLHKNTSLNSFKKKESLSVYIEQLNNICFADYMDRITFQKQIWQFNEMTSLIKTFKNNKLYHSFLKDEKKSPITNIDIRFTKVLTKYSTEYNNSIFIQTLCMQLGMDKKDLFSSFIHLRNHYEENQIIPLFENYEINKLDIHRIYRYLDKYTKEITKVYPEEIIEDFSLEDTDFCEE